MNREDIDTITAALLTELRGDTKIAELAKKIGIPTEPSPPTVEIMEFAIVFALAFERGRAGGNGAATEPDESDGRVQELLNGLSFACMSLVRAEAAADDLGENPLSVGLSDLKNQLMHINQVQQKRYRTDLRNEEGT